MKINYIIIPLIALVTFLLGAAFGKEGMSWYNTLRLPSATPPQPVFRWVWSILFFLTTCSALIIWNNVPQSILFWAIIGLFIVNAICTSVWSFFFFKRHALGLALLDHILLLCSTGALIILSSKVAAFAALMLAPYFTWLCFALYLNIAIFLRNKS